MEALKEYYTQHVTQAELARMLDVSRQQVSDWVRGKKPVPEKYINKIIEVIIE